MLSTGGSSIVAAGMVGKPSKRARRLTLCRVAKDQLHELLCCVVASQRHNHLGARLQAACGKRQGGGRWWKEACRHWSHAHPLAACGRRCRPQLRAPHQAQRGTHSKEAGQRSANRFEESCTRVCCCMPAAASATPRLKPHSPGSLSTCGCHSRCASCSLRPLELGLTPQLAYSCSRSASLYVYRRAEASTLRSRCECNVFKKASGVHGGRVGHGRYGRMWQSRVRARSCMPQQSECELPFPRPPHVVSGGPLLPVGCMRARASPSPPCSSMHASQVTRTRTHAPRAPSWPCPAPCCAP